MTARNFFRLPLLIRAAFASLALVFLPSATATATDIVLTLPFENTTNRQEYNWIRESFTVSLADLLNSPGIIVLSLEERNLAFEKLNLPTTAVVTRATEIKLGEAVGADLLVRGTYSVNGDGKDATITIKAQIISLREGKFLGNDYTLSGQVSELQTIQGRLAWELLYQRNMALPFSRDQLVSRASRIPASAYEIYVKALLTSKPEDAVTLLFKAIGEATKGGQPSFPAAMYELAMVYYRTGRFEEARAWFEKVNQSDQRGLVSKFYLGVCQIKTNQLDAGLKSFSDLLQPMPLFETYNNAAQAQVTKGNVEEASQLLKLAADAAPFDPEVQLNYGYVLWARGQFKEAIPRLESGLGDTSRLGAAHYFLAKCLEKTGDADRATVEYNEAKKTLSDFARWETSGKIPHQVSLKTGFNRESFYRYLRSQEQSRQTSLLGSSQTRQIENLLSQARTAFLANRDDDARTVLSQVLQTAPDTAEAHFLLGKVLERKGDFSGAINSLKAAVFWNPRLVAAHVLLGRLFFSRNDRPRAETHLKLALDADPRDRDALAFQQLLRETEKK